MPFRARRRQVKRSLFVVADLQVGSFHLPFSVAADCLLATPLRQSALHRFDEANDLSSVLKVGH